MPLYDAVAELPLEIDSYELERLEYVVSPEFTRVTTLVHLRGSGEEGIGEDVTYTSTDHPPPDDLPLAGSHVLDSLSELLDRLTIFAEEPQMKASHDYRRWAFESAALDLALRQAGRSLAEAVRREPRPVKFVSSRRLAEPQSADQLRPWLEMYPSLRFKLDPMSSWDDELIADLAATGAVDSVDLKGQYEGTVVDQPPDPVLYRRVIDGFPEAWIEDPAINDETRPILEPHAERITWDAPIHYLAEGLAVRILRVVVHDVADCAVDALLLAAAGLGAERLHALRVSPRVAGDVTAVGLEAVLESRRARPVCTSRPSSSSRR